MTELHKAYWQREELNRRRKSSHRVVHTFVHSKISEIQKHVEIGRFTTMLEVGAGNGFFSFYFEQMCRVVATDFSIRMITLNPASQALVCDAGDICFPNNSFDIVFESCMLHHLYDIDQVIIEMKRVSKRYLIFVELNRNNPLVLMFCALLAEERGGVKFSTSFMKKMACKHSLKIVSICSHGVIAPNKTPTVLLPILRGLDGRIPFIGFDNIMVCEKVN